jgi:hypothetical protein
MTVLARVQADIDRGDLGSARRRLASTVGSRGYVPDLLAKVAELSVQMRDPVQAGRYWLLTPASGPEVEAAVEAFVRACRHDARQMASELPRFRLRHKVNEYPEVVRARLARFGIDKVFVQQDPDLAPVQRAGWKHHLKALGCVVMGVGLVTLIVLGVRALARWRCG